MNSDFGQLVREGLDRLTAGEVGARDILARAERQHRRRRSTLRFTAGAATACVAAAAVVIATSLASAPAAGHRALVDLTALVTSRAEQALSGSGAHAVVQATVLQSHGASTDVINWSDARGSRTQLTTDSGRRRFAAGYLVRHADVTVAIIDYQNKTWQQLTLPLGPSRVDRPALPAAIEAPQTIFARQLMRMRGRCRDAALAPGFASFSWSALVRRMLSCGAFKVAGHGKIDGEAVVKLVTTGSHLPETPTLWISQASYLPLRLAFGPLTAGGYRVDLRWLPATPANLAKASILPAPSGFRRQPWRG